MNFWLSGGQEAIICEKDLRLYYSSHNFSGKNQPTVIEAIKCIYNKGVNKRFMFDMNLAWNFK